MCIAIEWGIIPAGKTAVKNTGGEQISAKRNSPLTNKSELRKSESLTAEESR